MNLPAALRIDLPEPRRSVYLTLVALALGGTECSASVDAIAATANVSKSTVQRAISWLETNGLIEADRSGGRKQTSIFRIKRVSNGMKKGVKPMQRNQGVSENTPYIDDGRRMDDTLSGKSQSVCDITRRLKVIGRRKQVRDGYLTFLAMLSEGQFVTASALAKELGLPTTTVRNDLMALFQSLDIPLEAQFRYRKSQRKRWHAGKMGGRVVPFYAHGGGRS